MSNYLICIDDGHEAQTLGKRTPPIPQLKGRVVRENEFNREVARYLFVELRRCGFRCILAAPGDEDVPLSTRTNLANRHNADLFISCHYNAGGGKGVETFHWSGSRTGKRAAELIHKQVLQSGINRRDRGVKTANFLVLRETKMPAVLIEFGFMDDPKLVEAAQMVDPQVQKRFAIATAKGICEYFSVKYVPEEPDKPKPMYRVTVDGKEVFDTAYVEKIVGVVKQAIIEQKREIEIKKI
ncbi:N-acetylmuramoyl-L-alanine amidase [Laceyella sediminis]|uniref:N-acetylmuramoyl-L-alanine amidase n=1 Tax=Laceyella sediminis TaxID=573074 RepID=A0ABX5EKK4_9BACL|nr:N-acetylmuramoyl-L-alanine amidase [Laceyella sediminis]PRZ12375.1 N-acetylmuramoyl-L-alanine amidase [Laceyella sediminis]